jgi:putative Ca2+/H+ antiporter (TMEM165/GDT1 family)
MDWEWFDGCFGFMDALTLFLLAASAVFVAEVGDKTMISTIILAIETRGFVRVLVASIGGFAVANVIAVLLGCVVRQVVDLAIAKVLAAALFFAIGLWMILRGEGEQSRVIKYSLIACFLMVFLMEMGDKTQLSVFSLTILYENPLVVLTGGLLGYAIANSIGVIIAKYLGNRVDWSRVKKYAGLVMILIGIWLTIEYLAH